MRENRSDARDATRAGLSRGTRWLRTILLVAAGLTLLAWALAPALRALTLVANVSVRAAPSVPTDLHVEQVAFSASDGVQLRGWLIRRPPQAPTIVLVHGFKGTRTDMLPWARFLVAGGYNVLLYDSRGCGQSDGWGIGLGEREPADVVGAVHYLAGRADLPVKRFGVLGISLGAGIALLAAAREPLISGVVADSAWTDERPQIDRMATLPFGPLALPALPYEPALVDRLIGGHLDDARPLQAIAQIAPRATLLVHSADDHNATTPLAGEHALYLAAGAPKLEWIAPSGGHTGALAAHPDEYQRRVLLFFASYVGTADARR